MVFVKEYERIALFGWVEDYFVQGLECLDQLLLAWRTKTGRHLSLTNNQKTAWSRRILRRGGSDWAERPGSLDSPVGHKSNQNHLKTPPAQGLVWDIVVSQRNQTDPATQRYGWWITVFSHKLRPDLTKLERGLSRCQCLWEHVYVLMLHRLVLHILFYFI